MTYKAYKYKDWPKLEFWLVYWMVMAAYMAVELLTDIFISWLPFYCTAKFGILIWLTTFRTKGSTLVFREIILPQLTANESKIDETLAVLGSHAKTKLYHFGSRTIVLAENFMGIALIRGYSMMQTYLAQRGYQHNNSAAASTTNQIYPARSLSPAVQVSATQQPSQTSEHLVSRKYLSPEFQMPAPQLPSPPYTPSPDQYAQSQDFAWQKPLFAPPIESPPVDYGSETTHMTQDDFRKMQAYQRVRKTSDAWSERQRLKATHLVPPRPYSAAPRG
ncbi:TB2/DP1, HVA22 family-domain-containing protein [Umbelopsis sp. AD052]|nr:TB2/DP1, HVA22 family-domain-containing protein [Umbelopsis sp. AD052]